VNLGVVDAVDQLLLKGRRHERVELPGRDQGRRGDVRETAGDVDAGGQLELTERADSSC
jgi:hypothetical protein